jgi:serine/threonine-protein kinase
MSILSESQRISPIKLLKRLQKGDKSSNEILEILEFQKSQVAPELLVRHALRLEKSYAERVFAMAISEAARTDLSNLGVDPKTIEIPEIKIMLIRFLGAVNQPDAAAMICEFLADSSKIVVIEALKNLGNMTVDYDPAPLVRHIPQMREQDVETALSILEAKASAVTLPALTPLMTGRSDTLRSRACAIAIKHASQESLEKLLLSLDKHEWWGKDQALKCLLTNGDARFFGAAAKLQDHEQEFVRNAAEQLSASQSGVTGNVEDLVQALMHENWQVRERAIASAGRTNSPEVLKHLAQVLQRYPESAIAVLRSVASLGFTKGLEITATCLQMKEAAIQREALLTIEALVNDRHALKVREQIIKIVPKLQTTVRDTALEVLESITKKFNLPELEFKDKNLFETRLVKLEELERTEPEVTPPPQEHHETEVVNRIRHIEEIKEGDYWMDRYKIVKEIGRGAMGRVMLAQDEMVGEELILKFMHPELTSDGKARERFLRELKYSRRISHPNVIRIHDFLTAQGVSAISMEYFESRGLDDMIKGDEFESHQQILKILYQVSRGMNEAHQQNVVHRDLKPSNVLVNQDNLAKVVDFGIASASSEPEMTLTKTGMIIGTPAYLSPERAKGLAADERSDIYALGIIAYAMFNGSPPYKGEPMSLLFQHIEGNAVLLHELDKGVSKEASMLVKKMMHVDLDKRFQTMAEVRDSIGQLLQ